MRQVLRPPKYNRLQQKIACKTHSETWCCLKHKWASLGIIPEINLQPVRCRLIDLDPQNKPWSAELLNNNNNDDKKKKKKNSLI